MEYRTKLLIAFAVWWLAWAYKPWHFSDWVLENILTVVFITLLIATRHVFRLSNVSYTVLFTFLCLHTIGSHYTYAEVPYEDWTHRLGFSVNEIFGLERNHYDRLVHFLFGFLFVYPMREFFMRIAGTVPGHPGRHLGRPQGHGPGHRGRLPGHAYRRGP
jgi:putative membrane protein